MFLIYLNNWRYKFKGIVCIRESPFENRVRELKEWDVYGYDPLLSDSMIKYFGVKPLPNLDEKMNAVIIAVAHNSSDIFLI